jgi:hypothetical protein
MKIFRARGGWKCGNRKSDDFTHSHRTTTTRDISIGSETLTFLSGANRLGERHRTGIILSMPSNQITKKPTGFFAYASLPHSIPETIKAAIETINKSQMAEITSWESLNISGRYIIQQICDTIDDSDFFCADVTTINPNVMFELGYAIGRDKRVWLIRDDSYADPKGEFEQLRLLTTIGYSRYTKAEQIIKGFFADKPHETLDNTIFREAIEPLLVPSTDNDPVLYLLSRHETEASVRVGSVLDRISPKPVIDNPQESSVNPLYWYGQKALNSPGILAHFLSAQRIGCKLTNARYALVSGLAKGFDRPLLMLTEQDDLLTPMDYRDQMRYYTTPAEAGRIADEWIQQIYKGVSISSVAAPPHLAAVKLATELRDFHQQLGEYVAENEADRLSDYFVETTAHMDIVNGTQTIFVGRKGTGKTASLIQAERELSREANNLVCVLKPVGYEMAALARLFASYRLTDHKGYVIESLWKYILYTELAITAVHHIETVTPWLASEPANSRLIELLREESALSGDFTVRLESAVTKLALVNPEDSAERFRQGISEALHNSLLSKLRSHLSEVSSRKRQVLLLVDNLDKPWTGKADVDHLTDFLLGLLNAADRVGEELRYGERNRNATRFNSAIFLRSDIFNRITEAVDEPDKISHTRLAWDQELLLRVIEERYVASHGPSSDPANMWRKYFCSEVRGLPTRDYLASRILPRPRDIVYIVKAAVSFAVNRKRDRVEQKDILDGELQYSQYAWDSILVENSTMIPNLDRVLLEFVGGLSILTESVLRQHVSSADVETERVDMVIDQLISLTFLGLEVSEGVFAYADERKERQKNIVLANKFAASRGEELRYEINAPFRAYLELKEPSINLRLI